MAEEPKAPEPELSITGEEEQKKPARPRNLYAYVKQAWKNPKGGVVEQTHFERMTGWRRGPAFVVRFRAPDEFIGVARPYGSRG